MGMSHDACTHPRTPAGRAACRKAGGPGSVVATTPAKAPRQKSVTPADEAAYIEARRDAITAVQNDTPAKRGRKPIAPPDPAVLEQAKLAQKAGRKTTLAEHNALTREAHNRRARPAQTTDERTTKQRMDSLWGGTTRRSYIRAEHDMADVPHVFSNVIRFAWEQGWEVWRGDPYNDTERRLVIATTYGTASLVWKSANPNGINGQFWRPVHTSITSRIPTVNRLLEIMKEMS